MMTDDDLLYDPNMDDDDQTWVDDVRLVDWSVVGYNWSIDWSVDCSIHWMYTCSTIQIWMVMTKHGLMM